METSPITIDTELAPPAANAATSALSCEVHGIQLTPLGIIASREDLSAEEYNTLLRSALVISRASNWIIGDTLNIAERLWGNKATGSKYAEAAAFTGLSISALKQISLTCRAIPYERRHADLSFTHHVEARSHSCNPDIQDNALAEASEQKQSIREMRKAMRSAQAAECAAKPELSAGAENDDRPFGLIDLPERAKPGAPPLWDALKFADWVKKQDPEEYDREQCEQALELAAPIAEYYEAVCARMKELDNPENAQNG